MFNHIAVELSKPATAVARRASRHPALATTLLACALSCAVVAGTASAQPVDLCSPSLVQDAGTIATFAGSGTAGFDYGGFAGDGGPATGALMKFPTAVAIGQDSLFIADTNNHRIRRVDLATCVIDTVAGSGVAGSTGDGSLAINARLNAPRGVAVSGNLLFISDTNNHRIRRVDLTTGVITLLTNAVFGPQQLKVQDGYLYVAEASANIVSRIDPATGIVQAVAGSGTSGYTGDGGPATSARLYGPRDLAFHNGKMYIADRLNARVRVVDLTTGIISTFAGTGFNEQGRDGYPASLVGVTPNALAVSGNILLVADDATQRVRTIDLTTGLINTVAGTGTAGFSGDYGPGPDARVDQPNGMAVAGSALWLADMFNQRVRRIQLGALQAVLSVAGAPSSARNGTSFTVSSSGGSGAGLVTYRVTGGCTNVAGGAEITMTASSGVCSIAAAQAGDLDYLPTVSLPVFVTAQPPLATQSPLVVSGAPASAPFGATFTVNASGGSGSGALSFTASGVCATVGAVVGSSVLVQMVSGTGLCSIVADKAGDATYAPATSAPALVTAQRVAQAPLLLTGAPASAVPGTAFPVFVSGGGGTGTLIVTATGACLFSASDSVVTLADSPGTCTITAQQAGDADYLDASATAVVEVGWPPFAITSAPAYAAFDSSFTVAATGGGGAGEVTFAASGACANSDGGPSFTMTSGSGACTVTATKAADGAFPGAADTAVVVARRARQQPLQFSGLPVAAAAGSSFQATITGGSGSGTLTVLASGGCSVIDGDAQIQITSASLDCQLGAVKAGDANYEPRRTRPGSMVAWVETALQSTTAISSPSPDLVQAGDGLLYGTTSGGGSFGYGSIFAFDPATNALQVVYSFAGPDGARPDSGLVVGADGLLYGVTPQGGGSDWLTGTGPRGTVFRFDPATSTLTTLHVFAFVSGQSFPTGASPGGRLTQGSDGLLYGTTSSSGPGGQGTVFRLDPVSGTLATVFAFSTPGPARPESGLVEGPDGALYGTTYSGGAANLGTVFRLEKSGALTTVRSLVTADGTLPLAELHVEPDGSLYGSTTNGGTHGNGTVFVISPAGAFTVLHAFTGSTSQGGRPVTALARGQDGDLYGIAPVPGYPWTTLFRLTPGGAFESGVALFTLGTRSVLQVDAGTLYGVSPSGSLSLTRLTPPPAALVYSRQVQATLLVTGAPAAAAFSASFTVGTSGGSGSGVVTFATSGACTNIGAFVTMTSGSGTCSVTATKAGDSTYAPATSAPAVVAAQLAPQAPLAIAGAPFSTLPGTTFSIGVSGGSGTSTLQVTATGACSMASATDVTAADVPGDCTLTALKAGDANYQAASATVVVAVGWPPLRVTAAPAFATYGASFTVGVDGGSGSGAVTFTATGACENVGGGAEITMTGGTGTCSIVATKAADGLYPSTDSPAAAVVARRARQAPLALAPLPATAVLGSTLEVEVTGGSGGGAVSLVVSGGCALVEGTSSVVITSGSVACNVAATKAGDTNFESRRTRPAAGAAWSEVVLQTATAANGPAPHLVQAGDGRLYGASTSGGSSSLGTIFTFDPATNVIQVVRSFDGPSGARPSVGLVAGVDGLLYGVTREGGGPDWLSGTGPRGTVFRFDPATSVLTTLHVFGFVSGQSNAYPSGSTPEGRLTLASDGMLYGTTSSNGPGGQGTVFRIDPRTGTFATVHAFSGADGSAPLSLAEGPDGALYGNTRNGGANGLGTIFRLEKTGALTTLHTFTGPDGQLPTADLQVEPDGTLFGTTVGGGAQGAGTVFVLPPAGSLTTLHSFTGTEGGQPTTPLAWLRDGDLYGVVPQPGYPWSRFFSVTPGGGFTLNPAQPVARSLFQAEDGTVYGISPVGGQLLGAVRITRLTPAASAIVATRQLQATLAVTGAPATAVFGSSFTVSAAGGSGTGAVSFIASGACANSGPLVSMTGGTGTCSITATKDGDAGYAPATSAPAVVAAQLAVAAPLVIDGAPDRALPGATFTVSVSGGSGAGVVELSATGSCTIDPGSNLVTTSDVAGDCTVTAVKPSDGNYQAASSSVVVVVAYTQAPLSLVAPAFAVFGESFTVTTTGGSGTGEVTVNATGACTNSGPLVTMTSGTGLCELSATKAGDGAYPPIDAPAVRVGARRAWQESLQLGELPSSAPYATTFPVEVTGGSASATGAVSVVTTGGCGTLDGGSTVVMTSGWLECGITAEKAGDQNFEPVRTTPDLYQSWNEEYVQDLYGAGGVVTGLVRTNDGRMYGMSSEGGAFGLGTIFEFDPATSSLQVVHSFGGTDGARPDSELLVGSAGLLYGVTPEGGGAGWDSGTGPRGTVFSFDPSTGQLNTLHVFEYVSGQTNAIPDGANPSGPLVLASDGLLYGTTMTLGPNGEGTVFSVDPTTGAFSTLHAFAGADGARPEAGVVEGRDGALYGTTYEGGPHNLGTLFRLEKTGAFTTIVPFTGPNGHSPQGELLVDADGSIYGTTTGGGDYEGGTVFRLSPGGAFTTVHSFDGNDGATPSTRLTPSPDGLLYGVASQLVFVVSRDGTTSAGLWWLNSTNSLLLTDDGRFYFTNTYDPGGFAVMRLTPPSSALVYPEQIEQAQVVVSGAPATAENGSTFPVTVLGGSGTGYVDISVDGVCTVDYNDGVSFLVTMTADAGTCTIRAYNYGDDNYYGVESDPVEVQAIPATVAGTAPVISSVSPITGTVDGGTLVTIRGSHFTSDASVAFGGVPAVSVVFEDESTIHAETPPNAVATVDVVVSTAGGTLTATAADAFVYGPAPAIGLHGPVVRANLGENGETYDWEPIGALSADGSFVAFVSADGVVAGEEDGWNDVFVRDLQNATVEQVSLRNDGTASDDGEALVGPLFISADGRYVVFTTTEALVAEDTNAMADVYVRDRADGTTVRASLKTGGGQIAADTMIAGPITPDGRFVAFVASGTGVTSSDVFPANDVFVRDLVAGTTAMISLTDAGFPANGTSEAPSISDDGRYVAFASTATNLAGGGAWNVFLRDRDADGDKVFDEAGAITTTLVSASAPGVGGNQASTRPSLSADGNTLVFQSVATNLVLDDTNGVQDVFLFDRQAVPPQVQRVNLRPGGVQATGASSLSAFGQTVSTDGRFVIFSSTDAELVPFDGNLAADVFRYDRTGGTVALVSAREDGARTDGADTGERPDSINGVISADGRQVMFVSSATNLLAEDDDYGDGNGVRDLFVKTLQVNTPAGPSDGEPLALVDPSTGGSPVLVEFSFVSEEGTTSLTRLEEPPPLPTGFSVAGVVYDISTTAELPEGVAIEICISYAGLDVGDEGSLRLKHYENGAWVDITTYVDTSSRLVCGLSYSLSPFAIAVPRATTLSVSATASVYGSVTTLLATVTPAGVPGSVAFSVNGGAAIPAVYDESTGVATVVDYTHGLPARGASYEVRAVFTSGDVTFASSRATNDALVVGQAVPVITFGPAPSATYLGSDFTVTATTSNPENSLLTFDAIGGPCVLVGGATFRATGAGTCVVRAAGAATANYVAAEAQQGITLARAVTTMTLVSAPNPSTAGQAVTFTATVTSSAGPVTTGSVTFREGSTVLAGSVALSASGTAAFTTSTLPAGTHTIVAEYAATTDLAASTGSVSHTVSAATTYYAFNGFFAPIDMPMEGVTVWNAANAGKAIPVKWQLTLGGVAVSNPSSFQGVFSYSVSCSTGAGSIETAIEEYATGSSTLTYNGDGNWQYNWKTAKSYAKTCRVMFVKFDDGTNSPLAYFKFK